MIQVTVFIRSLVVIGIWLIIGTWGYHYFQGLPWLDALLNASMILSGMGPVNVPETAAGKWFSAFYALFSGVVFIAIIGLLIPPILSRLLRRFHLEG